MLTPKGRLGRQYAEGNRDYFVTWGARAVDVFGAQESFETRESEQLVYIANEVPETFSVFLQARILEGFASVGAGQVSVEFDIRIGVGTGIVTVPYFIVFDPTLAAPAETFNMLTTNQAVGWKLLEFPAQQPNIVAKVTSRVAAPVTTESYATAAPRFKVHYLRETPAYVDAEKP